MNAKTQRHTLRELACLCQALQLACQEVLITHCVLPRVLQFLGALHLFRRVEWRTSVNRKSVQHCVSWELCSSMREVEGVWCFRVCPLVFWIEVGYCHFHVCFLLLHYDLQLFFLTAWFRCARKLMCFAHAGIPFCPLLCRRTHWAETRQRDELRTVSCWSGSSIALPAWACVGRRSHRTLGVLDVHPLPGCGCLRWSRPFGMVI